MTEKAKTKVELFTEAAEILRKSDELEHAEFLEDQARQITESYAKRKTKETKASIENKEYSKEVTNFFNGAALQDVAYTLSEIAENSGLGDLSPQKVAAIMKYVENVEKVDKATNDKKKAGYKRVEV